MGGVRRRHLPSAGPQGRRLPARADARGGLHASREGPLLLVQGPAAVDLPDPGQVPRRGPAPCRPAPGPRVLDEGRLLVRLHRRRPRGLLPGAARRLRAHLRPPRSRLRHRAGGCRRHGRFAVGGVPAPHSDRRGHLRALRRRVRRERRGLHHPRAAAGCRRRHAARGRRAPVTRLVDDPDPRRSGERRASQARTRLDRRRHAQERRARAQSPRRHPRDRRRRAARRPRCRPQAGRGGVRPGRGGARDRGGLREEPRCS